MILKSSALWYTVLVTGSCSLTRQGLLVRASCSDTGCEVGGSEGEIRRVGKTVTGWLGWRESQALSLGSVHTHVATLLHGWPWLGCARPTLTRASRISLFEGCSDAASL